MPATHAVRTQRFLTNAQTTHGTKYDYTQVNYLDADTKVTIICPTHGPFQQIPASHVRGHGCEKCGAKVAAAKALGRPARPPQKPEKFFVKAEAVHGDRYDYSQVVYERFDSPVTIICREHGPFEQRPYLHVRGKGCGDCGHERRVSPMRMTREIFIDSARRIHGDRYKYDDLQFVDKETRLLITCNRHGEWPSYPETHLMGKGCPKCGDERMGDAQRMSVEEFIARATELHEGRYTYEQVEYVTARQAVIVTCIRHGDFSVPPGSHLSSRSGCPRCVGSISGASQRWLDTLDVDGLVREVRLAELPFRVDGLDAVRKVVYEFQGCFWHGCPHCYDPAAPHPRVGGTYADLFAATQRRSKAIRDAGYLLVEMWEHDWAATERRQSANGA